MIFGLHVFQRLADPPVDVAFGHVTVGVGKTVDVSVGCGAVRYYGNPASVRTDGEMMQNILNRHTKHHIGYKYSQRMLYFLLGYFLVEYYNIIKKQFISHIFAKHYNAFVSDILK